VSVGGIRSPAEMWAQAHLDRLRVARWHEIGYPGATDITFPHLADLLTAQLLNNVGHPYDGGGTGRLHTKDSERDVIDMIADLFSAPPGRWGYGTSGGTEAILHAMADARESLGERLVVYTSDAAHYAVGKAARLLRVQLCRVPARRHGGMKVAALGERLRANRKRPAFIVATAGTTMTEAVDDVAAIARIAQDQSGGRARIHVDAALSGIPLALLPPQRRPRFDFASSPLVKSISISGHKFLGTLTPCGVIVYAGDRRKGRRVSYIGSTDRTVLGSRSGHAPLLLWWSLTNPRLPTRAVRTSFDRQTHTVRAEQARELARYTKTGLIRLGWPAHLNRHSFTVTFAAPPPAVLRRWVLPTEDKTAHVVCMPGVVRGQIDDFLTDLESATRSRKRSR